MKKTVKIEEEVWEELQKMKIESRRGSLNEVIKELLDEREVK